MKGGANVPKGLDTSYKMSSPFPCLERYAFQHQAAHPREPSMQPHQAQSGHNQPTRHSSIMTRNLTLCFADGSCLELVTQGAEQSSAMLLQALFEDLAFAQESRVCGVLPEPPTQTLQDLSVEPFARCCDCGEWAVGELLLLSGIRLPFCTACIIQRTS